MPKSVFTDAYQVLRDHLIALRRRHRVSQVELARRLGKEQPFISRVERGERRLDVIEFVAFVKAIGASPEEELVALARQLPEHLEI